MGAGAAKAHASYAIVPAPGRLTRMRPADAVDFRDDRPVGAAPLGVDAGALDAAIAAAGVEIGPDTNIKLRLRAQSHPGEQGHTKRLGPDSYRIVVHVAAKELLQERHLYVLANSVLHELRHVQQMQVDAEHQAKYVAENLLAGYANNKYEVEARYFGRLANHTGTKDTGPAGPALGKKVWVLRPPFP